MEALGPLVGESLSVERHPIEVREGVRHSVRIGDAVQFEIEDVVRFGSQTGEPVRLTGAFHPAGSELTVAHATRSKIDAFGIQYEGNAGLSTPLLTVSLSAAATAHDRRAERRELAEAFGAARLRVGLVLLLLVLAAAAWWLTAQQLAGLDAGPGTDLGTLGWFLGVWVVMMAEMMSLVGAHHVTVSAHDSTARLEPSAAFHRRVRGGMGCGGAVRVPAVSPWPYRSRRRSGLARRRAMGWSAGALALAAMYELMPLKDVCLGKCRGPLGFLLGTWRDGSTRRSTWGPGMPCGAFAAVVGR
jgi:hypothetical protein